MTLSEGQFKDLHGKLMRDGGFSANSRTGAAPDVGYMVAVPGYEKKFRSQNFAPAHIKEFAEKHADQLTDDDRFIGGWKNKGVVDMDVSQNIVPDSKVARNYGWAVANSDARTSALDLSIARNQEAAYDIEAGGDLPNPDYDKDRPKPGPRG